VVAEALAEMGADVSGEMGLEIPADFSYESSALVRSSGISGVSQIR
jgi:hypothetical protein